MSSNMMPGDNSGSGEDERYWRDDEVWEKQTEAFIAGAQQMREMLARFVETSGLPPTNPVILAMSMRANWVPGWGKDPGKPDGIHGAIDAALP
jgi:hypothetical protein